MKEPSSPSEPPADDARLAALHRALADRERQLRDLTEQSLGFLEDLAEERRRAGERERLGQRIGELERQVADARRRLLHAGGAVPVAAPDDEGARPALEIVFWGADSHAAAAAAAAAGLPAVWVGLPEDVPPGAPAANLPVAVNRTARTGPQCWNLGFAATRAEAVLFVGAGLTLTAIGDGEAFARPDAALVSPRIETAAGATLGVDSTDDLLRLAPHRATDGDANGGPFASARAFAVRRAAFDRVGAFDEGRPATAALVDWTLRARRANFTVAAAPDCVATDAGGAATAGDGREELDALADRDRLHLIAGHFPDRLGRALADAGTLWEQAPHAAPELLGQLLGRLPANDNAVPRELLDRVAIDLAAQGQPGALVIAQLQERRLALLRALRDSEPPHHREEVVAALDRAGKQRFGTPAEAFRALADEIGLAGRVASGFRTVLQETRTERQQLDAERHAQSARAERAVGSRESVQAQLDAAARELAAAREQQQQTGRLAEQLRGQLDAQTQANAQMLARAAQLDALLADRDGHIANRDQQLAALKREHGQIAGLLGLTDHAPATEVNARLGELKAEAHRLHTTLVATLQAAGASDPESLLADLRIVRERYAAAQTTLAERERWIGLLLAEVQKRRLRPRALLPHEQALLDRLRAP